MRNSISLLSVFMFMLIAASAYAQPDPPPANDHILSLIEQVNADSLESYTNALVGFHTRHTYSDTTSDDTGVGAARRWLIGRYADYNVDAERYHWTGRWDGEDYPCYNVHATLPSQDDDLGQLILGGHLDSRNTDGNDNEGFAPGADDDGSSIAAMLEMGRIIGADTSTHLRTIRFCSFTGEEQGLLGSTAYAQALADNGDPVSAMLNMDMIAHIVDPEGEVDSSTVRVFSAGPMESISRQLARYVKWVGSAYSDEIDVLLQDALDRPGRGGDHKPFSDAGFASVRYIETAEDTDYQHDTTDVPSAMSFSYHAKVTKLVMGATLALANAPDRMDAPIVASGGDGFSLAVYWDTTAHDRDVYIACRHEDDLYWDRVMHADTTYPFIIDSLTTWETYFVSVAYAPDSTLPSLFSDEVSGIPDSLDNPPFNFEATSTRNGVYLEWDRRWEPNVEAYQLFRQSPGEGFVYYNLFSPSITDYLNRGVSRGSIYGYRIRSYYGDNRFSLTSPDVKGAFASHHLGALIVDATPNGEDDWERPDDAASDEFWDLALTDDFQVDSRYDRNDSVLAFIEPTDADFAAYRTVIYHADGASSYYGTDTTAIRKFMQNGGKVFLSGWKLSRTISGVRGLGGAFRPGDFFYDYLGIDSIRVGLTQSNAFIGIEGADGYPDVDFDSERIGVDHLTDMDAIWGMDEEKARVIATFKSDNDDSPFNGKPVVIMDASDPPKWIFADLPFFNMTPQSAKAFILSALSDLGAQPAAVGERETVPTVDHFILNPAYPNPFNGVTRIEYALPRSAVVTVAVYDLSGRLVDRLVSGHHSAGWHSFTWDAGSLPSAKYFIRLTSDNAELVTPVELVK